MPNNLLWVGTADSTTTTTAGGWNYPANWSVAGTAATAAPASGDFVSFAQSTANLATGPNSTNQTAVLAELDFFASWTGLCPASGVNIGSLVVNCGQNYGAGNPAGSSRILLALTNTAATQASQVTVFNTPSASADVGKAPLRLTANNAASLVDVRKGIVGIGTDYPGQTAVLGTASMSFVSNPSSDAQLEIGSGVTLASLVQNGGAAVVEAPIPVADVYAGQLTIRGSGACTTLVVASGATVYGESAGTISFADVAGTLDMSRSSIPRTLTGAKLHAGATLLANKAVVTLPTATSGTASLSLDSSVGLNDVTIDLGNGIAVRVS